MRRVFIWQANCLWRHFLGQERQFQVISTSLFASEQTVNISFSIERCWPATVMEFEHNAPDEMEVFYFCLNTFDFVYRGQMLHYQDDVNFESICGLIFYRKNCVLLYFSMQDKVSRCKPKTKWDDVLDFTSPKWTRTK